MLQSSQDNDRIVAFDFLRVLCTLGILVYHYCCHLPPEYQYNLIISRFINYANGPVGYLLVILFYMLSGASIYYRDANICNIGRFYWKRWKSIFPVFYVATLILFIINVFVLSNDYLLLSPPYAIIPTILGVDGWMEYSYSPIPNGLRWFFNLNFGQGFNQVGEWFIGSLLVVYLLYPITLKIFNKRPFLLISVLFVLLCVEIYHTNYDYSRGVVQGLFCFVMGMAAFKYRVIMKSRYVVISFLIISGFILVVKLPFSILCQYLLGISLFVSVYNISNSMVTNNWFLNFGSKISFSFFLVQHWAIIIIVTHITIDSGGKVIGLLLVCILLATMVAYIFYRISLLIIRSSLFNNIDHYFNRLVQSKKIIKGMN